MVKAARKLARNARASWKSTSAGIIAGVLVILTAAHALLDGDPETVPDADAVMNAIVGICLIVWGVVTRDGDKTSSETGAE